MSGHSDLFFRGEEEDMAVDTVCTSLGVSCYHGKEGLLGFCCAEYNALQSVGHNEALWEGKSGEAGGKGGGKEK